MNKSLKWVIVVALVAGASWFWYSTTRPSNNKESDTQQVQAKVTSKRSKSLNVTAQVIEPTLLVDEFSTMGVLLPDENLDLTFETNGKIVEINFNEGTQVSAGEILARINSDYLQAQRDRLTAQLKLAQDRVYRQTELLQRDAVSREALEQVQTDLAILKADIDIIDAQIDRTMLIAPFDGVVGLRQVSVGSFASTNTVIATLTKNTPLKIDFSIPERYSSSIGAGANLTFKVEGEMDEFKARVYAAESSVDSKLHQYSLRAMYDNKDGRLMAGRYVKVSLKKDEIKDAIAIPPHAIVPEMGKDKVFLYRSGKAEPVEIETGLRTESDVQVLRGLEMGDTLIVSGTLQLRTGLSVTLDKVD